MFFYEKTSFLPTENAKTSHLITSISLGIKKTFKKTNNSLEKMIFVA